MSDVKCPRCGAKPGDRCVTSGGNPRDDHVDRLDAALGAKKTAKAGAKAEPSKPKAGLAHETIPFPFEVCSSCSGGSFVSVGLFCNLGGVTKAQWRCEGCGAVTTVEG